MSSAAPTQPRAKANTYAAAALAAVTAHGMLSRAALAKECATAGFGKPAPLKQAIAKLTKEGKLAMDSLSYVLGAAESAFYSQAYAKVLERAERARADKALAKIEGQAREAKRVSRALREACHEGHKDRRLLALGKMAGL